MNIYRKSSTLLVSVLAAILAVPGAVWFGEGCYNHHDRGWNKDGYKSNVHFNNPKDGNDKLWISLLGGGILGYRLGV